MLSDTGRGGKLATSRGGASMSVGEVALLDIEDKAGVPSEHSVAIEDANELPVYSSLTCTVPLRKEGWGFLKLD